MEYDFDLFVIGGGSGGVRCARIAAGYGARVGIAEERFWGGTCVNIGCIPKKLMVQAASYGHWIDEARSFGWHAEKQGHSWQRFIAAKNQEVSRLSGLYEGVLKRAGAVTFNARAAFIDRHTLAVGNQRVSARLIVIATGGSPSKLDMPGAELSLVSDDIFFLPERPSRIAIIGSGYIAVEFAGIFAGLGSETHLVYRQPLPLRGFDEDLRSALGDALAADGVHLHPSAVPKSLITKDDQYLLRLPSDREIKVDAVLCATGRRPNLNGLNLERAEVAVNDKGAIIVDGDMRTNQSHIYAVGDVTDQINLTPVATAQGHALADTLFGGRPRQIPLRNIPTAVFSSPPVATVGLTETEAARHYTVDVYLSRFTPLRHAMTGQPRKTLMKLIVDQISDRVVGAHMLGEDAPEIIQGIAVAITAGVTKADFDQTIGIHPTAAEEFVTMREKVRVAGRVKAAE